MIDLTALNTVRLEEVKVCPLCKSRERNGFELRPLAQDRMHAVQCSVCGLVYMDAVIAATDVSKLFDKYSERRNIVNQEMERKRNLMYALDYAFVRQYFDDAGTDILDVGCADGSLLAHFSETSNRYGIETDRTAREHGRKLHPEIAWYESLDAVPTDKRFAAIVFRGTLQYMPDLQEVARFCSTHVVWGGFVFLLALPNSDSLLAQIQRENWVLFDRIEQRYSFGLGQVRKLFAPAFEFTGYDFPYFRTPYENYESDLQKVVAMFDDPSARGEKVPFFGSMMNVALRRVS